MNEILLVGLRVLHIAAAATVVGAAVYQAVALTPTLRTIDEGPRAAIRSGNAARWAWVAYLAIAVLLLTGLANFLIYKIPDLRPHPAKGLYHALFGVKFLLALAAFHAATVLVLPGAKGDRYRAAAGGWLWYMLALFGLIIVIAAVMRHFNDLFPPGAPAAGG